jgi:Protein of unknown function (DUF3137)
VALLFVVLLVGVAIAIGAQYVRYRAKVARTNAVAAIGRNIGFTFSAADIDRIVSMPFVLFSRGKDRRVELVISGTHDGVPMRLFDYWYYDETSDGRGNRTRQYHRFTCALATIPAACPRLQIGHENFLTRLGDHFGLRDVELEYDEFNRQFRVKCDDQKFAFSLLDGKMMEWLLASTSFASVEVDGPWVLVAVDKLDPSKWLALGSWLEQFHHQIPPVVYSTYPPR